MFDLTISLGNILVIVAFIGGGISFVYSIKNDNKITDFKYTIVAASMDDFKMEMKKLTEVVTQQALQNNRMDYIEDRQMSQGKRLDQAEARLNLYADSPIYRRQDERPPS